MLSHVLNRGQRDSSGLHISLVLSLIFTDEIFRSVNRDRIEVIEYVDDEVVILASGKLPVNYFGVALDTKLT